MSESELTRRGAIGVTVGIAAAVGGSITGATAANADDATQTEYFLSLSADATGFSVAALAATNQSFIYMNAVREIVGGERLEELLRVYREEGLDQALMSPKLGPIARNIIKLWYTATWEELPRAWRDLHGALQNDRTFVVSPTAYTTGLLWPSIGANAPGANAPGYGRWSNPPGN